MILYVLAVSGIGVDPRDANAAACAQKNVHDCASLTSREKNRAHFWCGFFYGQAVA